MAKALVTTTNNNVEFNALISSLLMCRDMTLNQIEVEGDFAIAVNATKQDFTPYWRLNGFVDRAGGILILFEAFTVNHVYKEANGEVDKLANKAIDEVSLKDIFASEGQVLGLKHVL